MNSPFKHLRKLYYKRVTSPYLPCKPGNTFRTALVEGKEAPIEVYSGRSKGRPDLLNKYLIHGYRFSEERKRQIQEQMLKPKRTNSFDSKLFLDALFSKTLKISLL